MNKIIELQETSPSFWKARYRGNYGTYTIKIETDGRDILNFSCSCPSDYYPCKHIPIVQEAINERISKNRSKPEKGMFENVVRKMSLNDLQEFVIRFGLHNSSFQQAVLLEFTPQQKQHGNIDYSEIIRCALEDIDFDMDDIYDYHYDSFEIDVLDQWLNKAREYIEQDNWKEAILIAKACLEEYAFLRHYIVYVENKPVGFGQWYDCFDAKEDWYTVERPDEIFSIDYFIGEEEYLRKGYGKAIVKELINMIKQWQLDAQIVVQPDLENIASGKALEANGFAYDEGRKYYSLP